MRLYRDEHTKYRFIIVLLRNALTLREIHGRIRFNPFLGIANEDTYSQFLDRTELHYIHQYAIAKKNEKIDRQHFPDKKNPKSNSRKPTRVHNTITYSSRIKVKKSESIKALRRAENPRAHLRGGLSRVKV